MSRAASGHFWGYVCVALFGAGIGAASVVFLGNADCNRDIEPLMGRIDAFEAKILSEVGGVGSRIGELAGKMDAFSESIILRRAATLPDMGNGSSEEENRNGSDTYLWLSVLPSAVGRELVLRGLSPYDSPKVADYVQEVCKRIDTADSQYRSSVIQNNEDYSTGKIADPEFQFLQERFKNEHANILLEAMSGFSASLRAIE